MEQIVAQSLRRTHPCHHLDLLLPAPRSVRMSPRCSKTLCMELGFSCSGNLARQSSREGQCTVLVWAEHCVGTLGGLHRDDDVLLAPQQLRRQSPDSRCTKAMSKGKYCCAQGGGGAWGTVSPLDLSPQQWECWEGQRNQQKCTTKCPQGAA